MLHIAFAPIYKYKLPPGHRFPMEKYELLPDQLLYEGTVHTRNFFHPTRMTEKDILSTHLPEYWNKLKHLTLSRKEERRIGFPVREDLVDRGRYIAQGTYECTQFAHEHGIAMNIAGGTHHAFPDRGEGFCVFNDIALAANMMLRNKEAQSILIIDLDVHQGNGTAHIFREEDRVFTFSMHGAKNFPMRKERSDLDIGLPDNTGDELYLGVLEDVLPRLVDRQKPDFIFYLSGVDVIEEDKLGRLSLSKEGCKQRDRIVLSLCKRHRIPVAVSMGGGYAPEIRDIIDAHANTYRVAQEMYF